MSELFQNGEEASRGKFVRQLETLQAQGEAALQQIETARLDTLVRFERRLSAMNGRRQRANRLLAPRVVTRFAVSDFLDIDQAQTTATVRADVQAVTLRERQTPTDATIRTQRFSTTGGSVEAMDSAGRLYRTYADDGRVPTGVFDLELAAPLNLTLLVFDLAAMPSEPQITVEVSATGNIYVPATQTTQNGYRLTAWVAPQTVRYIRLTLAPSHPDTLGGRTYTFGLTAFSGSAVEFHLLSEFVSRSMTFRPRTTQVRLVAAEDPGLAYFLAFNDGNFVEAQPGVPLDLPNVSWVGTNRQGILAVDVNEDSGLLAHALPSGAYPDTLWVTWEGHPEFTVTPVPGLTPDAAWDAQLTRAYVGIVGSALYLVTRDLTEHPGKTFALHYAVGPTPATVRLKVQLATSDCTATPVFRGAVLEELS